MDAPPQLSTLPPRGPRGLFHPRDEAEVQALIHHARTIGAAVRVRGAAHSAPAAIHADAHLDGQPGLCVELSLDHLRAVHVDPERAQVRVGAGCRFGRDPRDPTGRASAGAGLCAHLAAYDLALPDLGGVVHQTVAGFLMTGSAGGSTRHGLHQAVVGLTLVDGTGRVHRLKRAEDDPTFWAAGVSMGLLGVITEVVLACEPRYDLVGEEQVVAVADAPFDPLGVGPDGLAGWLTGTDHARVEWWARPGVDRMVIWRARRMTPADYTTETGGPDDLRAEAFGTFDELLGSPAVTQMVGGALLRGLSRWRGALTRGLGQRAGGATLRALEHLGVRRLEAVVYRPFVPPRPATTFRDRWHRVLPMDHDLDERFLPLAFAELWVPLERAPDAMRRMMALRDARPTPPEMIAWELYGGASSAFWLHPGYGRASIRFNLIWYAGTGVDPHPLVEAAAEALADLEPRVHWGKTLPGDGRWVVETVLPTLPRAEAFRALRATLDPDGLFLTRYWAAHLGISTGRAPSSGLRHRLHLDQVPTRRRRWPMLFQLEEGGPELVDALPSQIEMRGVFDPPLETMWDLTCTFRHLPEWVPLMRHVERLTEQWDAADTAAVQTYAVLMSGRFITVERSPPRRWSAVVDRASVPLFAAIAERYELEPTEAGGTAIRWRFSWRMAPGYARLEPLVRRLFQRWFDAAFDRLAVVTGAIEESL